MKDLSARSIDEPTASTFSILGFGAPLMGSWLYYIHVAELVNWCNSLSCSVERMHEPIFIMLFLRELMMQP